MKSFRFPVCMMLITALSGVTLAGVAATAPSPAAAAFAAQALAETAVPVRPGEPGVTPFWNSGAVQFLYAPAFAIPAVAGAKTYRFTLRSKNGDEQSFTAPQPWAALSPVWPKVAVGPVTLTVQALDGDGRPLDQPAQRTFHRAAPFGGVYAAPASTWRESARTGLAALAHSPDLRCWFGTGGPAEEFHLYRYPYKIVGAAAAALAIYATQTPVPADAPAALAAARRAADYLLSLSLPVGSPWAFHPPTYHPTMFAERLKGHMSAQNYMTSSGAESGLCYLSVYKATGDRKYLDAAVRIAETYAERQRSDGSWPLFVRVSDGSEVTENTMIPTMVVDFLDRLAPAAKTDRFDAMRARALAWIESNPVRTWNWQGQFEDVKPLPPYENLTKHDGCDYAIHLLRSAPNDPAKRALALDLLRFAEDQFIMWAQPPSERPGKQSADGVAATKPNRWLLPCVLEQYRCYAPVCASSAKLIRTYLAAYGVTRDRLHLEKARALAATLTRTQANAKAPGRFLTWVMQPSGLMWFNCELLAIEALQELAAVDPSSP